MVSDMHIFLNFYLTKLAVLSSWLMKVFERMWPYLTVATGALGAVLIQLCLARSMKN
jgi:hypothetical protein